MKPIIQTFVFALCLVSNLGTADEPENDPVESPPIACYQLAAGSKEITGVNLNVGQAVELCGGATDAIKVIQCFVMAFSHPESGGLGLNAGNAIRLCKENSQPGFGNAP